MRRFAVLGNPIAHSKSPVIHAGFAEQCGHQIDYQKILVEPGEFDTVVTEFFDQGGAGLNVTAPFKEEAFKVAAVRTRLLKTQKLRIRCGWMPADRSVPTTPMAVDCCVI
jgi:shikimate dehydrogenase